MNYAMNWKKQKLFNPLAIVETDLEQKPYLCENEEIVQWQQKSQQELYRLLGLQKMHLCDDDFEMESKTEYAEYTEVCFTFQSEENYYVPCCLWIPRTSSHKKPPLMICLQGHSSGMHISKGEIQFSMDKKLIQEGDRDFAVRAIKEGYSALMMEQRYMGMCGGDNGVPGCVEGKALRTLLLGRCAIGERVWDVQRLIDVVEKKFADKVDLAKLVCMGNSGGGTTCFYAACMDNRIHLTVASCCISTFRESIGHIRHCGCNYIPGIAEYFDMGDLGKLIFPRCLIIVSGEKDTDFPIKGAKECCERIQELYTPYKKEENFCHVIGNEGHRFYADLTYPVIHKMQNVLHSIQ